MWSARNMLTRATFEQLREDALRVSKHERRVFAAVSVPLGVAALVLLRWAEGHVARGPRMTIAASVFVAYVGLIAFLSWQMNRRLRSVRPRCPECGVVLKDLAERVTALTGRCEACGGRVFDAPESAESRAEAE